MTQTILKLFTAFIHGRTPGQVVVQYTDHCNATCPQCGMRRGSGAPRSVLGIDQAKAVIDAAAERGASAISFTGGEPLLFLDDIVELIRHAGKAGIRYIRTGTNGFMLTDSGSDFTGRVTAIARRLADTPLKNFWISVDSADPATHEAMRGFPGLIRGIEKALPIFHEHGIYPSANLGINRNMGKHPLAPGFAENDCKEAFAQFYRFVISLGFTIANACYPMSAGGNESLDAVYAATSADDIVSFTPQEKITLFSSLLATIPQFRGSLRVFTPRCSLHALVRQLSGERQSSYPCRGGLDYFFIDAKDGNAYPCGYRGGDNLGSLRNVPLAQGHNGPACRECEWECFRDPSEMLGPVLELFGAPLSLIRRGFGDPEYFRLWLEDVRYYMACGFFDGRSAPNFSRCKPL
ncbi:MAG: radical SAM protein [Desulfuromonadales bacterium]|nr:MAG: radical SAM protein [Desulfuromonadales bacterium]